MARQQQVQTTEQIVQNATTKISSDISTLSARKNNALNVFRQTANELAAVNEGLSKSLDNLSGLQAFINEQSAATTKMMEDNDSVRARILEIIGE